MAMAIYLLCAACGMTLAAWALRRFAAAPSLALLLILPVIVGNPYDNIMIASGALIGAGPLLESLSWVRYLLHVATIPFWIVAAVLLAGRAGVRWAAHPAATLIAVAIAVTTFLTTLAGELLPLRLEPVWRGSLLIYADAGRIGPPISPLVLMAATLACGVAIWQRARWPWMALATFYVLAVGGLPNPLVSGLLVNVGEVLLGLAMLATERRFAAAPAPAPVEAASAPAIAE